MLYAIALGRSKMRLNGDSSQKEVKEFSSVIFSTAEFNFIDDDSMDGIKTRVFEVSDNLTKSAKNSDNIKKAVIKNYAVAGNLFIEHLLSQGKETIESDYEITKQQLTEQYKKSQINLDCNNLTERILSKLSIMLLSSKYINEIFDFSINLDEMTSYIFTIVNRIVDIPSPEDELMTIIYEDTLNHFKKYICSCSFLVEKFEQKTLKEISMNLFRNGCYGLIRNSKDEDYFEICIAQNHFKKIMQLYKIDDYRKRLKNLRESGKLIAQKDRQISKVSIIENMPKLNAYIFKFPIEKEDKVKDTYIEGYINSLEADLSSDNLLVDESSDINFDADFQ